MKSSRFLVSVLTALFLLAVDSDALLTVTENGNQVGKYGLYEINIVTSDFTYTNVWDDVTITATFTNAAAGIVWTIEGFYFDVNTWKIRLAPPEAGSWTWTFTMTSKNGESDSASGDFACIESDDPGFLMRHPTNPYRVVYRNGKLFNGFGQNNCCSSHNGNSSHYTTAKWGLDGGDSLLGEPRRYVSGIEFFNTFRNSGVNLFRLSNSNCADQVYQTISESGNVYNVREMKQSDTLCYILKENKMRFNYDVGGWRPPYYADSFATMGKVAAIDRYHRYMLARFGAFVDIWELGNEIIALGKSWGTVGEWWYEAGASVYHTRDPYKRMVSVSYENPECEHIDVSSPHWYLKGTEFQSDWDVSDYLTRNIKPRAPKPVIIGEHSNGYLNWDPLSALRLRQKTWTAFFKEAIFIVWHIGDYKNFEHLPGGIYLGPEDRVNLRQLQNFTDNVDPDVVMTTITPSNPAQVRAYGLSSSKIFMGYFHHHDNHTDSVTTSFTATLSAQGVARWMDPSDGSILKKETLQAGTRTLTSPAFLYELALKVIYNDTTSPPDTAVAAYWPLDEGSGTVIHDLTGNKADKTLADNTSWEEGRFGSCLSFDGNGDYVPQVNFPEITDNFTVAFWAFPKADHDTTVEKHNGITGNNGNQQYAMAPPNGSSQGVFHANAGLSVGTNGVKVFESGTSYLPSLLVYDTALTDWTHIAMVYKNRRPLLYINGALARKGLWSDRTVHPVIRMGGNTWGWYQGLLDEVYVFPYPLSGDQIVKLMDDSTGTTVKEGFKGPEAAVFSVSPNPFNPLVELRVQFTGQGSNYKVRIYDVQGQVVHTGVMDKTGLYRWNAGRLPSGMYIVHLQGADYSFRKRITLIK